MKNLENNFGVQKVHQRIIDFCSGLQQLYKLSGKSNNMLYSRIGNYYNTVIFKNSYFDIIRKFSSASPELEKHTYLIQIFDMAQ